MRSPGKGKASEKNIEVGNNSVTYYATSSNRQYLPGPATWDRDIVIQLVNTDGYS